MNDRLYMELIIWFDDEVLGERFPNVIMLREYSVTAPKHVQRSIDHFRDRLLSPSNSIRHIP
ncbi:MAG: hypothetical protein V1791_13305 [Pseudomonadota bacterium]